MSGDPAAGACMAGASPHWCSRVSALAQDEPSTRRPWSTSSTSTWVIVAAVLVMFMQAGFAFLEIGFSRGKNVGIGRREDPRQLLDRLDRLVGCRLRARLRWRRRDRWRLAASSSRHGAHASTGGARRGRDRRLDGRVHALPVHVLRRLPGDRLGHDARAHQVRRVRDLRGRLRGGHLPAHRPLDLRWRLPRARSATACRTSPARRSSTSSAPRARSPRCCCSARVRASTAPTASRARSRGTRCRWSASAC